MIVLGPWLLSIAAGIGIGCLIAITLLQIDKDWLKIALLSVEWALPGTGFLFKLISLDKNFLAFYIAIYLICVILTVIIFFNILISPLSKGQSGFKLKASDF